MPEDLSPETIKRMDELCRRVRVSPERDEQVQRELAGHVEDKLRAYISGGEKITEQDALLLVERHFGDVEALGHQLQSVHAPARAWLRRLAAIIVVSVLCRVPWMLLFFGNFLNIQFDDIENLNNDTSVALGLSIAFSWVLLIRWDKTSAAGQVPWFMRWRGRTLIGLVAISMLPILAPYLLVVIPEPHTSWIHSLDMLMGVTSHEWHDVVPTHGIVWLLERLSLSSAAFGVAPLLGTAEGVLWLWWLNRGSNTLGRCVMRILFTLMAWCVFGLLIGGPRPAEPFGPFFVYLLFSWAFWPSVNTPAVAVTRHDEAVPA